MRSQASMRALATSEPMLPLFGAIASGVHCALAAEIRILKIADLRVVASHFPLQILKSWVALDVPEVVVVHSGDTQRRDLLRAFVARELDSSGDAARLTRRPLML